MTSKPDDPESQRAIQELQQQVVELKTALEVSEKNFRSLTDSAPVGIYLDDIRGKATYINKKCAELIGVSAEDALGFDWLPFLHPDDRNNMFSEWTKSFEDGAEFRMEYRWVHSDGKIVWTLGEVNPIFGDDGAVAMYIGTLTDITDHKQAELEKEDLKAQLIQAQKMESIGRLAGGVAHDYNNMLTVILGNTELAMAEVDQSGPLGKILQTIRDAAARSAEITRQLLAFSRQQIVTPKVFDMNDSVKDMVGMLERLIGEEIRLTWEPQPGPLLIKMDPSEFDRTVVNLCVNARDAIDGIGKIHMKSAEATIDEAYCGKNKSALPGDFVVLSISDSGGGIDSAILENIFEPFFTTKVKGVGTGLGLASVYGTVKQSSGFIEVQSEAGAGTTFKIYLPRHAGTAGGNKTVNELTDEQGSGETILIVEDVVAILDLARRILERSGYNVLTASSPMDALKLSDDYRGRIDLLITDVIMPELNGKDLASRLCAERPGLQCLYMSGFTADAITSEGELEEAVSFIQKPFRRQALIAKVQETLDRTR